MHDNKHFSINGKTNAINIIHEVNFLFIIRFNMSGIFCLRDYVIFINGNVIYNNTILFLLLF